jgi:hypothetical protein
MTSHRNEWTGWLRSRELGRLARAAGAILLLALPLSARVCAEVVHTPVRGYIELTSGEYFCSWDTDQICHPCVNDADTPDEDRLIVAFGVTAPTYVAYGEIEGTVTPFVEIDGVTLTPDLLPTGSFFRSGVFWRDFFVPANCPNGAEPGVIYTIGSLPEATVQGDGTAEFDIPAAEAGLVPFSFRFCNEFVYWGVGCEIGGSQTQRWRLHLPQELRAFVVPAGDAPPVAPPGLDIVVDLQSGPGGTLTMTRGAGPTPVGEPLVGPPGYWEVNADLAPASFAAEIILGFAVADLPPEITPEELVVLLFDPAVDAWLPLATEIDAAAGLATATTDMFGVLALGAEPSVRAHAASWSTVKGLYATRPRGDRD